MDGSRRRGRVHQLVGYVKREWAKGAFSDLESRRCRLCCHTISGLLRFLDAMWENSTKQSVVHQSMQFLRESKESGKANPFAESDLRPRVRASTRGTCVLSDIEFQLCQEITTLIRSVPLVILQEKSRNWTSQLIGSWLTHWLHRYRIAHKRAFSEWEDSLSTL